MNYATVCSGIGAPEVAWKDLWGRPEFVSEIEPFPSAVLKHHYPDVPNYGDMTKYEEWPDHELELICGGTPCQSFSVAGLRKGMDDPRGNLTLVYLGILARYNPRWFIWENVPGVFSSRSNGGSDFGRFLSALAELGYSCAYRVLDAQYFGVPQRRRRVFVVGHLGADWRPPYAVLFEPESLRGNPPKSGKAGEGTARVFEISPGGAGECEVIPTFDSRCKDGPIRNQIGALVMAHGQGNAEICRDGSPSLTCNHEAPIAFMAGQGAKAGSIAASDKISPTIRSSESGTNRTPCVAIQDGRGMEKGQNGIGITEGGPAYTLDQTGAQAVAFQPKASVSQSMNPSETCPTIGTTKEPGIIHNTIVRRLTPIECERLQGFPDNYTRIPWKNKPADLCPDGPRYKALGNSMAVPVLRWIGQRIQLWESLVKSGKIKA